MQKPKKLNTPHNVNSATRAGGRIVGCLPGYMKTIEHEHSRGSTNSH